MKSIPNARIELNSNKLTRPDWTVTTGRDPSLLWLDKNENTDPAFQLLVTQTMKNIAAEAVYGYPDCVSLYHKLASNLQVSPNNLLLGAGSDGIIRAAFETFVTPGDTVVYTSPTFAMYSIYCQVFGAESAMVAYKKSELGPVLDVDELLDTIKKTQPKLVCLPNPDSPTGTVLKSAELRALIETAAEYNAVALIDEAYHPFYDQTVMPWIEEYSNLLVTRTFSKAWGLAGARVGYGAANNSLITLMHKVRPMYELGALSAVVVEKALDLADEMQASVSRLEEGKKYFQREMNRLGFQTPETAGNFLHVAFGDRASQIHDALKSLVLYRKDFPGTALEGYSRFTTTTKECFMPLVQHIEQIL